MTKDNDNNITSQQTHADDLPDEELDVGGKSLAEALRISFSILKVIMGVLVILFLASGFFRVDYDEQALVLRLGKIRGIGEDRVLKPGLHWVLPYPIDEIVKIPVTEVQSVNIDDFWYFQSERQKLAEGSHAMRSRPGETLDLMKGDGYCITRNEYIPELAGRNTGNDYNIVHCKWHLTYLIDDPELFLRNVYVEEPQAGQSLADVIPKSEKVASLLKSLAADAIVTSLVSFSIDEAILSEARIAASVTKLLQQKLRQIGSGIKIDSMQLVDITWPRQVDKAFLASMQAKQERDNLVIEAKTYAEKTLNEAGGPDVYEILPRLTDSKLSQEEKDELFAMLAGVSREKLEDAEQYRTGVVESAKADAEYLRELLPEYRKYPKLVIQKIYQDAIEAVLNSADEKIIVEPTSDGKPREIRLEVTKDPLLKQKEKE